MLYGKAIGAKRHSSRPDIDDRMPSARWVFFEATPAPVKRRVLIPHVPQFDPG